MRPEAAQGKPLEIWFQDQARVGQQGTLTRVWAPRGTRPRAVRDTRYEWAFAGSLGPVAFVGSLFGAACPGRGVAAGLILPCANTEAMNLHLAEIALAIAPGAHAALRRENDPPDHFLILLILDGAGWHGGKDLVVPQNITPITLPPPDRVRGRLYSPEHNPHGNVGQYLRANKLANTVFDSHDEILDQCCAAWNFFANDQAAITSIRSRAWAAVNVQGRWYYANGHLI